MTPIASLQALANRWAAARPAERANAQLYITELCDVLGVEPPRPAGTGYEFELPVKLIARDGTESQGFVDCYKSGHFVLEAKDYEEGRSNDVLLRKAFGQARTYASHDPSGVAPPYVLVLDVGKALLVWDRWSGTFGGYPAAKRIDLTRLYERPDDVALLVDIWTNPSARDPRLAAQNVTKEIAAHLAELAAALEERGFAQERVARFLMRCVFTMFAEDVGLLPDEPFNRMLDEVALPNPDEFPGAAEELWRAMDEGRRFGFRRLLRFNGHFFRDAEALPLSRDDLAILLEAARANWSRVEPTIFGTLLTRALDPEERQRLGAEYTPPEFIERLVRPTIEEPVRERWTAVQAEVLQLRDAKDGRGTDKSRERLRRDRDKAALRLQEFHGWLRSLTVLDPACGSGNFLYLAMHALKRVEVEVLNELAETRGGALELRMHEVDPSQFYGIEVKPWAREIAELTLWIGFHQFWRLHHGDVQPEEPLLRDTGTLECRDAVLAWDRVCRVPERDRPDPMPRNPHPVTGDLVPDPSAVLQYVEYVGARPAQWPEADFIVGNPPYIGEKRQRELLGDGYVDALRAAYPGVTDSADLVTYWWYKAAQAVASGRTIRAGLIATKTITQAKNRVVIEQAAQAGAHVIWAIANHPWVDEADGADVRVAMTVLARDGAGARLVAVDGAAMVTGEVRVPRLNADLSAYADVPAAAAVPLLANNGMAAQGFKLVGAGFVVDEGEAQALIAADSKNAEVLRPYRNGRDLATRPRGVYVIDFALRNEEEARHYPILFDIVRDRVKPERDANKRAVRARYWWRFGEPNPNLRGLVAGLQRFIATVEVSKHRYFTFLDASIAPDGALIIIGSADAFHLGVLSSRVHIEWALAAGGRLGVGNDPRYSRTLCFSAFPFPHPDAELRARIATLGEKIDSHRKDALARSPKVGMTAIYNVVERLRLEEPLSAAEREVHRLAACGTLRELHDELDGAVATAYGWSGPPGREEILERLVALHDQQIAEESAGTIRWLRADYQVPKFSASPVDTQEGLAIVQSETVSVAPSRAPWPSDAIGQITALRQLVAVSPVSVDEAVSRFAGAAKNMVARHLETLAILGEVRPVDGGRYIAAQGAA